MSIYISTDSSPRVDKTDINIILYYNTHAIGSISGCLLLINLLVLSTAIVFPYSAYHFSSLRYFLLLDHQFLNNIALNTPKEM